MYLNTKEFLFSNLILNNDDNLSIIRNGKLWKLVASFRKYGCIFGIYKNEFNYCVHSADDWNDNEEPNMGYYDVKLSYEELITEIANKYDNIRKINPC